MFCAKKILVDGIKFEINIPIKVSGFGSYSPPESLPPFDRILLWFKPMQHYVDDEFKAIYFFKKLREIKYVFNILKLGEYPEYLNKYL